MNNFKIFFLCSIFSRVPAGEWVRKQKFEEKIRRDCLYETNKNKIMATKSPNLSFSELKTNATVLSSNIKLNVKTIVAMVLNYHCLPTK